MPLRAKFTVDSIVPISDTDPSEGATIHLSPVSTGSEENESFYKYTPAGNMELTTVDYNAVKQFEVGKSYYLDFTPAE